MVHRVRKCRMLGSAALDMAYVACGRLDAYIEQGISLWDIAAGWLLVEAAGGKIEMQPRKICRINSPSWPRTACSISAS